MAKSVVPGRSGGGGKIRRGRSVLGNARGEGSLVEPEGPVFAIERLRDDCLSLFGVTRSTFDGAVYGMEGEFSVGEMEECIKRWMERRVTV